MGDWLHRLAGDSHLFPFHPLLRHSDHLRVDQCCVLSAIEIDPTAFVAGKRPAVSGFTVNDHALSVLSKGRQLCLGEGYLILVLVHFYWVGWMWIDGLIHSVLYL